MDITPQLDQIDENFTTYGAVASESEPLSENGQHSIIDDPTVICQLIEPFGAGVVPLENSDPCDNQIDDSSDEAAAETPRGSFEFPPIYEEIQGALEGIENILKPPRDDVRRSYKDPGLDKKTRARLEEMAALCRQYLERLDKARMQEPGSSVETTAQGLWISTSVSIATIFGHVKKGSKNPGGKRGRNLRRWVRDFVSDQNEVPNCHWNNSGRSLIDDEDLAQEIHLHLQSLKPDEIRAEAIVRFLDTPEMLTRLRRKKTISLATAQRWMQKMDYRWDYDPKGQYADGHEREDVVAYRQDIFLPKMLELEKRAWQWASKDGAAIPTTLDTARRVVFWWHDESTFYAHDRRRKRWIRADETAKPYAKGEGVSLMVADFFSAEYGWCRSPDGKESTRILFRAGKGRDGYFDNSHICEHAKKAMDLLQKYFPDEDHVLVFDNARTHSKRPDASLSALKMPKGPSANFLVEINQLGADGKPIYAPDGKIMKQKVPMANGRFADGSEQQFYYPADENHQYAGYFKGMAKILEERGFTHAKSLRAQCGKKFTDCQSGHTDCCCRRLMFNQPDFAQVDSKLELEVRGRGFELIFLPKFHCELNPIEQCWGYAKRVYRLSEPSTTQDALEKNTINALESVPLLSMRR